MQFFSPKIMPFIRELRKIRHKQAGRQAADAVTYYGAKTMRFTCRISKLNVGTQSHHI
jgi:hypothetical protein